MESSQAQQASPTDPAMNEAPSQQDEADEVDDECAYGTSLSKRLLDPPSSMLQPGTPAMSSQTQRAATTHHVTTEAPQQQDEADEADDEVDTSTSPSKRRKTMASAKGKEKADAFRNRFDSVYDRKDRNDGGGGDERKGSGAGGMVGS